MKTSNATNERVFLNTFIEQLWPAPAWLHEEPACVAWLDAQQKLNTCRIRDYLAGSPLVRLTINQGPDPLAGRRAPIGLTEAMVHPGKPDWHLDLTCLGEELVPFAGWLAAVVNRREGRLRRLPAPPFALLNWADSARLADYLYYLSAISLWSENAFTDDLHWWRRQTARVGDRQRQMALPLAG